MSDKLLAYAFGVVFCIVLLIIAFAVPDPSPFQIFVFRVVLSLTAAGIGAVLPGVISFNSRLIRAGGALALFAIVFSVNPPALVTSTAESRLSDLLTQGESALSQHNYGQASDLFSEAARIAPKRFEPQFGLARANFRQGSFALALGYYQRTQELKGFKEPSILYQIALCQDGLARHNEAIKTLSEVESLAGKESHYFSDAKFDIGLNHLLLAQQTTGEGVLNELGKSELAFAQFSEIPGVVKYWYLYHSACIVSVRLLQSGDGDKPKLKDTAYSLISQSLEGMKADYSDGHELQLKILRDILRGAYIRQPGFPADCSPLQTLIKTEHPDFEQKI